MQMQDASYDSGLYSPHSHHAWPAAAAPRPLGWKQQHQQPSAAYRPSFAAPAGQLGSFQVQDHEQAAAARQSAGETVLGAGVAGYTSVVTRSPISPSGYAVPALQHHQHQQHQPQPQPQEQQQQQWQLAAAGQHDNARLPYRTAAPLLDSGSSNGSFNSSRGTTPAAPPQAAAAAAALAALAGSSARLRGTAAAGDGSSGGGGGGGYTQQYAARNYTPARSTPGSSGRTSKLIWNVRDPSQQRQSAAPALGLPSAAAPPADQPSAGRRAAAGSLVPPAGGNYQPGGSSRPASQEGPSAGLLRLKQLSTARLASRVTTPPGAAALGGQGGSSSNSFCGSGGTRQQFFGHGPAVRAVVAAAGPAAATPTAAAEQRPGAFGQPRRGGDAPTGPTGRAGSTTVSSGDGNSASSTSSGNTGLIGRMQGLFGSHGQQQQEQQWRQQQQPTAAAATAGASPSEYAQVDRQPCPSCGRCFAAAALQQHARVCDRVFGQKRKVFNSRAARLQGTGINSSSTPSADAGGLATRGGTSRRLQQQQQAPRPAGGHMSHDSRPAASSAHAKKSKWQLQSEQLRAAMRPTRPTGTGAAGPAAAFGDVGRHSQQPEAEDTRIPCPHCGRRFAEMAAERHIPKCRDILAQPTRLKAGGGKAAYMVRSNSRGK